MEVNVSQIVNIFKVGTLLRHKEFTSVYRIVIKDDSNSYALLDTETMNVMSDRFKNIEELESKVKADYEFVAHSEDLQIVRNFT